MSSQNYQDPYAAQQNQSQQAGQPSQGMSPASNAYPASGGTQEHPQTQTVFIMGIVGIFVGIVSFIAWYMGGKAKKEIEAGAPYQWGGNLKTGYMLGKIFSIIYIVVTILYIISMIITAGAIMSSNR